MQRVIALRQTPVFGWLIASGVVGLLFILYTIVFMTGALDTSTLQVEHWLLERPVSGLDCTFYEWRHVGEVQTCVVLMLILSGIYLLAGFRRRVVLYLFILLGLSVIIEVVGKTLLHAPLPDTLRSGMTVLSCPQLQNAPSSQRAAAFVGLLGRVPAAPANQVSWLRTVAQMPLSTMTLSEYSRSYPAGHAARWCLLCLPVAWLCWQRVRPLVLRTLLMLFFGVLAFMGGFMQFYIAAHLLTDTIAGYLLGICLACCAIAVLSFNDKRGLVRDAASLPSMEQGRSHANYMVEKDVSGRLRS